MASEKKRRARWLTRRWRVSRLGTHWLITKDGFAVAIHEHADGSWGGRVVDQKTGRWVASSRPYQWRDAAKLAAYDVLLLLMAKRPLGGKRPPRQRNRKRKPKPKPKLRTGSWWRVLGFQSPPPVRKLAARAYRSLMVVHHTDSGGQVRDTRAVIEAWARAKQHYE